MKVRKLWAVGLLALAVAISGCGGDKKSEGPAEGKEFRVGVTAGPHAQVLEDVKKRAAKEGLNIKIVEFSDYVQPNVALSQGELDANSMQHKPFLDNVVADRGLKLVPVGNTILLPMAIYSKKENVKTIADVPEGGTVGIPNDPSNEGRALLLAEAQGLIKLKDSTNLKATPKDIAENPKNLKFVELEAAQVPQSLGDLDIAIINSNYAIQVGMNPQKDSLAVESNDSPYANLIVVQEKDKDNPVVKKFVQIYQSPETKKFIEETFKGSIVPAF